MNDKTPLVVKILVPRRAHSFRAESIQEIMRWVQPMSELLENGKDTGVALHHSQVSEFPLNFFVLKKKFIINKDELPVVCNARIIEKDKSSKQLVSEACLSYPFRPPRKIPRYGRVKVGFQVLVENINKPSELPIFKNQEQWVEGLMAQIFQHEIDHANGIHIYHL